MASTHQFNVLIADSDAALTKMVSFALESQFWASTFEVNEPASAADFVRTLTNLNLVIIGNAEEYHELLNYIVAERDTMQSILCVQGKISDPTLFSSPGVLGMIKRESFLEDCVRIINEKIFSTDLISNQVEQDFCKLASELLIQLSPLAADIYIALNKEKYLKIFQKGDDFDKADLLKYAEKKKVKFFYVKKGDSTLFIDTFSQKTQKMLSANILTMTPPHHL